MSDEEEVVKFFYEKSIETMREAWLPAMNVDGTDIINSPLTLPGAVIEEEYEIENDSEE